MGEITTTSSSRIAHESDTPIQMHCKPAAGLNMCFGEFFIIVLLVVWRNGLQKINYSCF